MGEDRMYVPLSRTELDLVLRALAVAAAGEAGTEMIALGNALDGRAVPSAELVRVMTGAKHALRSYQHGNSAPDLAAGVADTCEALLARLEVGKGGLAPDRLAPALAQLDALHAALALVGFSPVRGK